MGSLVAGESREPHGAGPARVRRFHRGLVRHLPGEQARGIATLQADWTRQDPRITTTLAALGRNAVPVYALYIPGEAQPRLLPELLTPALVLAEINVLPERRAP